MDHAEHILANFMCRLYVNVSGILFGLRYEYEPSNSQGLKLVEN